MRQRNKTCVNSLRRWVGLSAAIGPAGTPALAGEGNGTAVSNVPPGVELESELYAGKGGYLHGGLVIGAPINDSQKLERPRCS
jgi:hypothetical protein